MHHVHVHVHAQAHARLTRAQARAQGLSIAPKIMGNGPGVVENGELGDGWAPWGFAGGCPLAAAAVAAKGGSRD